jgi:hypothetical protein
MVLLVYPAGDRDRGRGISSGPENLDTRMKQLTNLFTKAALWRESE